MGRIHFTDSHAHLTSSSLKDDLDGVLQRAQTAGVNTIINICTDANSLDNGLQLSKRCPWVYNAASAHPHDVEKEGALTYPIISQQAHVGNLVAIGETGLDYHYEHSSRSIQQEYFRKFLHLAIDVTLPVIIHCREAFADFFQILDAEYVINGKHAPGVLHCFTGNMFEAEQVLKRDWYISLSGIITFKKSVELREVARIVPLDRLLIETDAPYLAPQSKRGHPNEPSYLPETAETIAALKGISLAELANATQQNTRRLFRLP